MALAALACLGTIAQWCPVQARIPHREVLGKVAHAWYGQIRAGGAKNIVFLCLVPMFSFCFTAVPPLNPLAPPDALALTFPLYLVTSFMMPSSHCPRLACAIPCRRPVARSHRRIHIVPAATASVIRPSPCDCPSTFSLFASNASSLAVLAKVDVDVAIFSPRLR